MLLITLQGDNSHRASLGNSTVVQLIYLPYTTKKSIRTRKIIPINNNSKGKVVPVLN
jgi:hypothetical protein